MLAYRDHQLHDDHRRWTSERSLWHDEVRIWLTSLDLVAALIAAIEE
jgi:hypothetical protein